MKDGSSFRRLQSAWKTVTRGTVFSSIFILLTTCIGAGTLSLPYGFAQGGLLFSSVVFFIIMIIAILVGSMLYGSKQCANEVSPETEVSGYQDLAEVAFGPVGKIAVQLTIAVFLYLALVAYMIYTRDQLYSIMDFALTATGHTTPCHIMLNCAVLLTIAFLPIFPLTLLRNLSPLQFTSYFSIFCVAYVAIIMTIKTSIAWTHNNDNSSGDDGTKTNISTMLMSDSGDGHLQLDIHLGPTNFNGALTVISYCSLSFICHFNLLPLAKELRPPVTKLKMYTVLIGAMLFAYVLYNMVIFAGYFNFFSALREDVMLNYPKDDVAITTARVALFFTLLLSYPVLFHPARAAMNSVVMMTYRLVTKCKRVSQQCNGRNRDESESESDQLITTSSDDMEEKNTTNQFQVSGIVWLCETWIIFATTILLASFVPNVGYVWNFVGSIGGVLVLYIYPPAFYLRLRYMRYRKRMLQNGVPISQQCKLSTVTKEIVTCIILITGVILLVVENYQAIAAVVNRTHRPLAQCFFLKCDSTRSLR